VLHVVVPRARSALELSAGAARRSEALARAEGERILDGARAAAGQSIPIATELLFGDPADTICQRAEELDVDLVVVGSRGLGMIERVLLGSVSTAVAQRCRRSVLVIR
jgi:nucleotide-binding universal stress UspA family protein